jgi:hypothetical protein
MNTISSKAALAVACIKLFSLGSRELIDELSRPAIQGPFQIDDEGQQSSSPFYMLGLIAGSSITNLPIASGVDSEDAGRILGEMSALLDIMLEEPPSEYIWFPDKQSHPVSGPRDKLWDILRRLSRSVIEYAAVDCRDVSVTAFYDRLRRHIV